MKKREVLALWINLNKLGELTGVKFAYAIAKNINTLRPEVESLDKSIELSDDFKKYDEARVKLVEKHADKDKDGNPKKKISPDGKQEYVVEENQSVFDKEFDALKKKNADVLTAREKQIDEYNSMLDTDSDFKPFKINLDVVPEQITAQQLSGIYDIIEE